MAFIWYILFFQFAFFGCMLPIGVLDFASNGDWTLETSCGPCADGCSRFHTTFESVFSVSLRSQCSWWWSWSWWWSGVGNHSLITYVNMVTIVSFIKCYHFNRIICSEIAAKNCIRQNFVIKMECYDEYQFSW